MTHGERIIWDREKRTFLAATFALTARWPATAEIYGSRFPGDLAVCGSLEQLRRRINAQYNEHRKPASPWTGIHTDRGYYDTDGRETMRQVEAVVESLHSQSRTTTSEVEESE